MINTYSVMLNENRVPYLRLDSSAEYSEKNELNSPRLIVGMANTVFELEDCAEEHLITVALDAKCHVLGIFQTTHGGISTAEASPRSILQRALLCEAATFVVCHNHPSGDCSPSKEDLNAAENIAAAGEILGIPMSDFIILGKERYYSFKEKGKLSV